MIISDNLKRAFCHIPKNGGTSLRRHFLAEWSDAREYQGRRPVLYLGGQTRDLTHITVAEAGRFFDDDLVGQGYTVTAIIRAPMPRLSSALLQYVRSFGAKDRHFVDATTVAEVLAQTSLRELCETAAQDYRHIYFRRQCDFVEGIADGQRDLILMEDIQSWFPGLPNDNKGGRLPGWLKVATRQPAIRRFAGGLSSEVRSRMAKVLIRKDPQASFAIAEAVAKEAAFVEDFYAPDQVLYARLLNTRLAG